ncbi:MAG: hypothetical protein BGO51_03070 [Rhodospirillales bacterium 69-11]|nr:hypothetical protein [Rhodospirillales bacterium]MBN8906956.1 hypothetical protein [Rhodospirillales bacterium]MBN8926781.1 hypothetical protein [Rhodospirillales bacterium]OJW26794.1 MAG: hypothetical protein BGO51_03070 [Rhodospirillales bacterium 69-11]
MLRLTFEPDPGTAATPTQGEMATAAREDPAGDANGLLDRVRQLESLVAQLEERLAQPPPSLPNPAGGVTIARHPDLHAAEAAGALRRVWAG